LLRCGYHLGIKQNVESRSGCVKMQDEVYSYCRYRNTPRLQLSTVRPSTTHHQPSSLGTRGTQLPLSGRSVPSSRKHSHSHSHSHSQVVDSTCIRHSHSRKALHPSQCRNSMSATPPLSRTAVTGPMSDCIASRTCSAETSGGMFEIVTRLHGARVDDRRGVQ
jgi:hypothetical protein